MPAVRTSRWPISLTSYCFAKQGFPRRRPEVLHRAISALSHALLSGLGSDQQASIAPQLEQILGQAYQAPFPAELLPAAQQKSPDTTSLFDLTTHRFHDDL